MDRKYTDYVVEHITPWNTPKETRFSSYNEARMYIETHFQNRKNEYKFYQEEHIIILFNNYNYVIGG